MPFIPTDQPWAEYYRQLFPGHTESRHAFDGWKYASTAVNIATQLWDTRSRALATYERRQGLDRSRWPFPHPPVLLWLPDVLHAGCLGCEWIDDSGSDGAAARARQHAIDLGGWAELVRATRVWVWERGGERDSWPPFRWA
jgi:hypothetical protein